MKKREITTIIFDLGGVILRQHIKSHLKTLEEVFNLSLTKLEEFHMPLRPRWRVGEIDGREYFSFLKNEFDLPGDIENLISEYMKVYTKGAQFDEEMLNLVNKLKQKVKVAILSNTVDLHHEHVLALGLMRHIDKLYVSIKLGMIKPDKEIYDFVANDLGVKSEECLFIDDLRENVNGAQKAGMKAYLFKDADRLKKYLMKEEIL